MFTTISNRIVCCYLLTSIVILLLGHSTCGAYFYVSPSGGDDNPGTQSQPFMTISKAIGAVRTADKPKPGELITVHIRGGVYKLDKPLLFTSADLARRI